MVRIGFVGLDARGEAICRRLAGRSRTRVTALDAGAWPWPPLAAAGVRRAADPAALAAAADIVFLWRTDAAAPDVGRFGLAAVLDACRAGQTLVDLAAAPPVVTRSLAADCRARSMAFADAPLEGDAQAAEDGALRILVGADAATFARIAPLLRRIAREVRHCGPPGCGQLARLLGPVVRWQAQVGLAEALAAARRFGADDPALAAVLGDHAAAATPQPGLAQARDALAQARQLAAASDLDPGTPAADPAEREPEPPGIFLSHNHGDKAFVRRLAKDLRRLGARVWVDEAELDIGDSLMQRIEAGLSGARNVGVVLSPRSVRSVWVARELEAARALESSGHAVRLLPMLIEDCELPPALHELARSDFRAPAQYDAELRKVAKALGLDVPPPDTDPRLAHAWMDRAVAQQTPRLFRRAVFAMLTHPGASDANRVADLMGGCERWGVVLREAMAEELLAAIEYDGEQGLAAVAYLRRWGAHSRGQDVPAPLVDALASTAVERRVAADLYHREARTGSSSQRYDAKDLLPDPRQPLHLRVAAAHLAAWNDLDPVLQRIGQEPPVLQQAMVDILDHASQSIGARSLALPGLAAAIGQLPDGWLKTVAASAISRIVPALTHQAQQEYQRLYQSAQGIVAAWRQAPAGPPAVT